ncbi:PREDICTED: ubiquitin carboxyl-terminal hydrolase 21-like isoform X2 [Lupinus angustifolius]|uniref:ubiquitin carboxyl-terminal hydrolase 21-like isoform X2 n=1 Tax=Lupinus angustifolius TaxID=3871 RepID=UPI00092E9931|nr:PREDICTED: ubiquitin carboxyl-terminal hydrolase 21-like isoform X2 [Lupinus angustifolius]
MCKPIPAPTKPKVGKDQANPSTPPPSALDSVSKIVNSSQLFDCIERTSAFDDVPMPLSVAPPSGDVIYLCDPYNDSEQRYGLSDADLSSPYQSSSKYNFTSWDSWPVSDEKPQVCDPEPNHTDDQNWFYSSDPIAPPKNEDSPSRVGAGLSNLGNTCFMNAILQCFTHTVPLIEGLRSSSHAFPCDCYHSGFCVMCALRAQIECSLASSGGMVSPWRLVKNLSYFSSSFSSYQQEDAHEFMQCALDKLDRCFLDLKENNESFDDVNLVDKIFGGRLLSKLRCSNCGHSSNTYEPLIDMSLEIENVDTLPNALESFTKLEHIESNFKCDGCKVEVTLEKQLLLDQTPSVAAFHLKRFKTDGNLVEKLDKHVDFPLELDLQLYSVSDHNSNEPMKYDLYAVVVHIGLSATSGHYFCYVRSAPDIWHKLDDLQVTRVSAESVLSQEAYILFYAQQGTPWFSNIMESPLPCLDPSIWNTSPKSVFDRVDSSDKPTPIINSSNVIVEASESKESSKPNQESVGLNGVKDINQAQVPLVKSAMLNVSTLVDGDSHVECGDSDKNNNNDGFNDLTPPSSPHRDFPDRSYQIPRGHLKKSSESAKRSKSKLKYTGDTGNSERKAAVRYASKMHGSRRDAILALVECNGKALNKRKEVDSSLCKENSHRRAPKKPNHASVMRPVAFGICYCS